MAREDYINDERVKLKATLFNNLGVASMIAIFYTPVFVDMPGIVRLLAIVVGLCSCAVCHAVGSWSLRELRDH